MATATANISDRAKRYRAQNTIKQLDRICVFCGDPKNLMVGHVNGDESDGESANLVFTCRSCNVTIGIFMARAGFGKRTAQYNPAGFRVEQCGLADQEHEKSRRQYAHTFHRPGVICIASEFLRLPEVNRLGILLHELGHLMSGQSAPESAANKTVTRASGIPIEMVSSEHGERLERISEDQIPRAFTFLVNYMDGVGTLRNPAGGARSLGQWIVAVTSMKGAGPMKLGDAVDMVRSTSPAKRLEYAREIWRLRRAHGTDKTGV